MSSNRSTFSLILLGALLGWTALPCPAAPVPAAVLRARLQRVAGTLDAMANVPRRPLGSALQPLLNPTVVRRDDGTLQTDRGDQWTRLLIGVGGNATRAQVRTARLAVAERIAALDRWTGNSGVHFWPADAQAIVQQLEATGQIRTGPTWWEQHWVDFKHAVLHMLDVAVKWLFRKFPWPTAPVNPHINFAIVRLVFKSALLCLLLVVGYLMWKAVGGRVAGLRARREVIWAGEDDQLLALPTDELRARARNFAREGNFAEALRHLYIALLVELDTRSVWRYDSRRTNSEHIAALAQRIGERPALAHLIGPLTSLTRRFDRVRYGNATCDQSDWLRFEGDTDALLAQLTPQHGLVEAS